MYYRHVLQTCANVLVDAILHVLQTCANVLVDAIFVRFFTYNIQR